MRVDNRTSIAYAAAPARSVRRGVVSPEVLMRSLSKRLDSIVGNMMRTRRMHARLAYVVRVDDRASIAYAAAPARSVRRGVVSPEVLMQSLSSQCHASRIKNLRRSARAINVKT